MRLFVRISAVLLLAAAPVFGWLRSTVEDRPAVARVTLEDIRARGELRLATRRATLSYFVHEGEPAGFEHDLLQAFATDLGVSLSARAAPSGSTAERWLREGRVDVAVLAPERTRAPGVVKVGSRDDGVENLLAPTGDLYVTGTAQALRVALDAWLQQAFGEGSGGETFRRYFGAPGRLANAIPDAARARHGLPAWESLIARHARAAGYDERLIAALIFQESSFDPSAVSPKGAIGLMQVLPVVGEELGILGLHEPEDNVRAGIRHLRRLSERFTGSSGEDHLAFVLSAYLLGPGHVEDAQALARSVGLDPDRWWGSVEEVLPLLEDERFYRKARHGYARGRHAVDYVYRIFRLHHHFRGPPATATDRLAARPQHRLPAG